MQFEQPAEVVTLHEDEAAVLGCERQHKRVCDDLGQRGHLAAAKMGTHLWMLGDGLPERGVAQEADHSQSPPTGLSNVIATGWVPVVGPPAAAGVTTLPT